MANSAGLQTPRVPCGCIAANMISMQPTRRKRIKHYERLGHVHELTFSCYNRRPLLTNDAWRQELCEAIDRATDRHKFRLYAFVIMPEHVHLLVQPSSEGGSIPALLRAIKRPFSYKIKQWLTEFNSRLLDDLTVRQRPGVTTFRFWQEGPGYDRNLTEPKSILAAIEYIHLNPVRRGLCQAAADWRWSSVRWFLNDGVPVEPGLPKLSKLDYRLLE